MDNKTLWIQSKQEMDATQIEYSSQEYSKKVPNL